MKKLLYPASFVAALLLSAQARGAPPEQLRVRAVAPPAGDLAIEEIPPGRLLELGAGERITLLLKDAPVREVLQILARRAGCNIVFGSAARAERISMDVQKESLEDTFNFALRLGHLQATRVGRTILVDAQIPADLLHNQIRTFRINQADAAQVAAMLGSLGAQINGSSFSASAEPPTSNPPASPAGTPTRQGPLTGELVVAVDARTNSLTAVGTPRALRLAQAQITRLDVRQRQVMIALKLVDVNLNNVSDLGFRIGGSGGNFQLGTVGGTGNLGNPYLSAGGITGTGGAGNTFIFNTLSALAQAMALRLDAAIQEGSARVLASPQIVVQAGESFRQPAAARVEITDDVVVGATTSSDRTTGLSNTTVKLDKVGVILDISVFHIDDNGYIDVALKPQVSSVIDAQRDAANNLVTLLTRRNLDIQRVRLRDGETFVIGGVLREIDRQIVQKVPILGDLPLLGPLFRFQNTQNERREVALTVTPHILNEGSADVQEKP